MTHIPILSIDEDGLVKGANAAARATLGAVKGRRCVDVMRARSTSGTPICRTGCAAELARGETGERDRPDAVIRGVGKRLVCTAVGNAVTVAVLGTDQKGPSPDVLTGRERQVLSLVAQGLTDRKLAERLGIRPSTARTHVENIRMKLGARTRAEAVTLALSAGELD